MSMTDPIADFLTRIRNGIRARKQLVELPALEHQAAHRRDPARRGLRSERRRRPRTRSRACSSSSFATTAATSARQRDHRHAPRVASRASAPTSRPRTIPRVRNGLGIAILSTSQGVMTDREARNKGVGGEVLCEVW